MSPPLALNFDIYLFNWTNPESITNHNSQPILKQLGPYRFKEKPEKVDVVWHPDNSSVSFRKLSVYHFDAENSGGQLDDVISTLNIVAAVCSYIKT